MTGGNDGKTASPEKLTCSFNHCMMRCQPMFISRLTRAVVIAMYDGKSEDKLTNKLEICLGRSG